jgi:hypothetical protein
MSYNTHSASPVMVAAAIGEGEQRKGFPLFSCPGGEGIRAQIDAAISHPLLPITFTILHQKHKDAIRSGYHADIALQLPPPYLSREQQQQYHHQQALQQLNQQQLYYQQQQHQQQDRNHEPTGLESALETALPDKK